MKRKIDATIQQADAKVEEDEPDDEDNSSSEASDSEEEMPEEEKRETKKSRPGLAEGESRFKVAKLSKTELYKPPTNEEVNRLRETENLFHSTLFRMEITELLAEVKLREKRKLQMTKAVETLKTILQELKPGKKLQLDERRWLKKAGIKLPVCDEQPDAAGFFQFLPPQEVRLTGSFVTDTCVKPDVHVDLIVVIPKDSFSEKDYLNHRYSRKRAMYLCKLAHALAALAEMDATHFFYHHSNHLKPALAVHVKVEGHKSVEVRLHAVADPDTFKLSRFHINKNNVRSKWFYHDDSKRQEQKDEATPFCNSTVLEDLAASGVDDGLRWIQAQPQGIKDGLVLLKLWLRQRQLDTGYGGFSGFVMTMFVQYLLYHKKLSQYMSSYQVMRNTLLRLSQSDWTSSGITLCRDSSDMYMPTLSDFHQHFDVVFVDKTGYLNLCYSMNKSLYQRVVHEAGLSLAMLDDKSCDSFTLLFIRKLPFCLTFDHIFHVEPDDFSDEAMEKAHTCGRYVDFGGHITCTFLPAMLGALKRGLGSRVTLMQVQQHSTQTWDVTEDPPDFRKPEKLTIGLLLNSDSAFNIMDRGPSADTAQAVEFRKFWGDKSELRRFHGGGICEAVLWTDKTQSVCEQIVRYVLKKHVGIHPSCITYLAKHLDPVLTLPLEHADDDDDTYGMGDKQNAAVIKAFDDLSKQLHRLDDMPLTISSIQGRSAVFRYTEVFPPLPYTVHLIAEKDNTEGLKRFVPAASKPCPWYMPSLKVVCMLESSGKWPDDLEALRRLKTAFYLQLAQAITAKYKLPVRTGPTYLDVLKDSYVFRLELACMKEMSLLRSERTEEGMMKKRETEATLQLEKRIIALPKITGVLHGLHKQTAFGPSVRLAKRWLCCHLLADYIHPVAVELIVAHLFLSPSPHTPPWSGSVGFLRFLSFLSKFDWKTTPLMVDLNNEYTDEDRTEIATRFSKERGSLPLMFISTPLDKFSRHWTQRSPDAAVLHRLVLLAQSSLTVLQRQMMEDVEPDYKLVFRPSFSMFDVLIHLREQQVPRQYESLDAADDVFKPKYGRSVEDHRFPVVDYDPVQMFLTQLRETFDELCLFFYDPHGSLVIGLLWKPSALQKHDFKTSHINYSRPLTDTGEVQLEPNVEAILEDISVIGRGLVQSIEVKDKSTPA